MRLIKLIRFLPVLVFFRLYHKNERLIQDVNRWDRSDVKFNIKLADLLYKYKEFRNLFIYRNYKHKLFYRWIKLWYPPEKTLFIECSDIGGGFFILHGFATYIAAKKIGKNFTVNQQVTIGYRGTAGCPVIGDNVYVTCGAKVLGNITIGDNVRVGANAVVIKDYKRGHGILVGVPAVPKKEISKEDLKKAGVTIDESLF